MTDTEIINLFFERSEQAITELAKSTATPWPEWRGTSWGMNRIPRSA